MDGKDEVDEIKHETIGNSQEPVCYKDDLYYDYSKFNCVRVNRVLKSDKMANEAMESMVKTVMKMIQYNVALSDDILILCYNYCNKFNQKLQTKFIKLLQSVSNECLDFYIKSNMKQHKYAWFKEFLLTSNIWFCDTSTSSNSTTTKKTNQTVVSRSQPKSKVSSPKAKTQIKKMKQTSKMDDKKSDDENIDGKQMVLYHYLEDTINTALLKQKEFIHNEVNNEEKIEGKAWNDLLHFEEYKSTDVTELRQDCITNGIQPDFDEMSLFKIAPNIDNASFDCFAEYVKY